jgi:hypothetical protein
MVAVEFKGALVALPTVVPPVLPSQVFSAKGWKYSMGMATDTKFVFSINVFIFTNILFCYFTVSLCVLLSMLVF